MSDVSIKFSMELLINGESVVGEGNPEAIVNPSNAETLVLINEASSQQIDDSVKSAQLAGKMWAKTTPKERADYLIKIANLINKHADLLSTIRIIKLR